MNIDRRVSRNALKVLLAGFIISGIAGCDIDAKSGDNNYYKNNKAVVFDIEEPQIVIEILGSQRQNADEGFNLQFDRTVFNDLGICILDNQGNIVDIDSIKYYDVEEEEDMAGYILKTKKSLDNSKGNHIYTVMKFRSDKRETRKLVYESKIENGKVKTFELDEDKALDFIDKHEKNIQRGITFYK